MRYHLFVTRCHQERDKLQLFLSSLAKTAHGRISNSSAKNTILTALVATTASAIMLCLEQGKRNVVTTESDTTNDNQHSNPSTYSTNTRKNSNKLLFLGTGSSTGCPRPLCTMLFPPQSKIVDGLEVRRRQDPVDNHLVALQKQYESSCSVSRLAVQGNPVQNKNYRNNPSILISHTTTGNNTARQNIIIDVGKTFREGAIRWISHTNNNAAGHNSTIHSIDAILLTHEHMDSVGGLDDVRGFQTREKDGTLTPISVYLTNQTLQAIRRQFHYLVPNVDKENERNKGKGTNVQRAKNEPVVVKRLVAALDYQIIEQFKPFVAGGMKFTPIPVMHGEDMICMGFAFSIPISSTYGAPAYQGRTPTNRPSSSSIQASNSPNTKLNGSEVIHILYLSDISRLPPETEQYILTQLPPTNILIIDSLLVDKHNATHVCMREAIDIAQRLQTKKVYLVGMNCDDFLPHDEMNEQLLKNKRDGYNYGLDIELAYDGLLLEF